MAETSKYNLTTAALEDGTIDFYALLNETSAADAEVLKSRIQTLYAEAQANRDHRNLNKRREYQTLLELLPAARAALLEEPKRARYDAYLTAARAGNTEIDFETFMNDLMGFNEQMEEKTGLLGIQEKKAEPRVKVIKTPVQQAAKPEPVRSNGSGVSPAAIMGGVGGFILGAIIGFIIPSGGLVPAILLGVVLGAIGFVVLNKKPGGKIGV